MKPSEILHAAANLLKNPGAWTQKSDARDAHGYEVRVSSPKATCWCAFGAIVKVIANPYDEIDTQVAAFLRQATGIWSITSWNDAEGRTQEQVIAAFLKAEQLAKDHNQ